MRPARRAEHMDTRASRTYPEKTRTTDAPMPTPENAARASLPALLALSNTNPGRNLARRTEARRGAPSPRQTINITRRDPAVHNFFCANAFFFALPQPSRDAPPPRRTGGCRSRMRTAAGPGRPAGGHAPGGPVGGRNPSRRTSVSDSARETPCARRRPVGSRRAPAVPRPGRLSAAAPGAEAAARPFYRARSYCAERRRGSSTSLNASPNRLKPNTASVIARPGKIATQGALSANSSAPP